MTGEARERDRGVGRLNLRAASWLAWALAAFTMAMFLASAALYALYLFERSPGDRLTVGTVGEALGFVPFLAFPVVGALIASRRPQNPIGWICLADGLFWSLLGLTDYYSRYGMAQPGSIPFSVAITASLGQWLWLPPVGLLGIYMILLFPDGKLPSRRWHPLAWLSGTVIVFGGVGFAIDPGPLPGLGGVRNPFGVEGAPWGAIVGPVVFALLPLCILASVLSLVLRFRGSRGEERQQIKWIAFAASLVGLLFLSVIVTSLIPSLGYLERVLQTVVALSYAGVPIAVGLAVLRYRLYDIDLLINRTLVYGLLTALLAATYFGGVVSLQFVVRTLTGQESQLAVVASTLSIAALFVPLRRRVQGFVDRRFYRSKYDAAKTLDAFSVRLRDETQLDTLSKDLVGVVTRTVQPAHASLWLRPETGSKGKQAD